MSVYSITDARAALPAIVDEVQAGTEVELTRHGRVVAVLVNPATLRARRAGQAGDEERRLHALLAASAAAPLRPAGLSVERAEELITAIRRDRDADDA